MTANSERSGYWHRPEGKFELKWHAMYSNLLGTPLSEAEEKDILTQLADGELPPIPTSNLILRLGRTGDPKYEGIIKSFIDVRDPDIAAASLRSLIRHLDKASAYGPKLKEFVRGVEWDLDGDLRLQAIQLSADYLKIRKDLELVRTILEVFNQFEDNENPFKQASYAALAALIDRDQRTLRTSPETALIFDIDDDLIREVKRFIRKNMQQ